MSAREVVAILGDRDRPRSERLARLQGWRDEELEAAGAAGQMAQRIGPAVCAAASVALAGTRSVPFGAVVVGTAAWGAFAANHPVESALAAWSRRRGRPALPTNRAAKRLGCAVGAVVLGAATVAFAEGAATTGTILALSIGSLATFVATTNVCVPSILFVSIWGEDRSTRRHLVHIPTANELRMRGGQAA